MANKFMTSAALLLKALSHPKLAILALRERGLRFVATAFVKSEADELQRLAADLEYRAAMPATPQSLYAACKDFATSIQPHDEDHLLVELKSGEKFFIRKRGAMFDAYVLKETFVYEVYRTDFALAGKIVVDVGANIGDTAVYFAQQEARVFGYEPSKELYELARKNIELNAVRAEMYNIGVGDRHGKASLTLGDQGPDSKSVTLLDERSAARAPNGRVEEVEVVPFADVIRNFDAVELVKMDCEGCEYAALRSLADADLARIRHIIMEYHGSADELVRRLQNNGFMVRQPKTNMLVADRAGAR